MWQQLDALCDRSPVCAPARLRRQQAENQRLHQANQGLQEQLAQSRAHNRQLQQQLAQSEERVRQLTAVLEDKQ